MSAQTPLERTIASWMADEATGRTPVGLVDDILVLTSRERPRPRWFALLKEPPMRLHSRMAVGSPTRRVTLAAALALLILAATAVVVGALVNRGPSLTSDDWPGFRGDSARNGSAIRGPVGRPVQEWRYQASGSVTYGIAIVGDTVFASSSDGLLHALNLADGTERWTFKATKAPLLGPTVVGGLAYVIDGTNRMNAVDAATGTLRWQSTSTLLGASEITVGDGRVYIGTADGFLVALDAASGREDWRVAVSTAAPANSPAFADGLVFAASNGAGLTAFEAATGKTSWHVDTGADQVGTPVVSGGLVYIGASADATTGHLRAVDEKTGRLLWTVDDTLQAPAVVGTVAYTSGKSGRVAALDTATGATRWSFQVQGGTRAPAVAAGIVYIAAIDERRVYALDAATGGYLWRFDVDSSNQCCIAVAKGSVFVGTVQGSVYDIGGDGSQLAVGPAPTGPASAAPTTATASATPAGSPTIAGGSPAPEPAQLLWKATGSDGAMIPNTIARDPAGRLWVGDPYGDRFAIFKPDGTFVEYWGTAGSAEGQLSLRRPSNGDGYGALAFAPDGSFYVLDVGNQRVQLFDAKRQFVRAWGKFGSGAGQFIDPVGIAVGSDGKVHVLDDVRGVVETYDAKGTVLGSFKAFANAANGLNTANSLAVDARGNFYISDILPEQVERFDPSG
ncbi:MAG TPA: PQQ-binding-like beta-propeller repeat protein, partial [Candidatus Bathyarchaeia archaeon]|nr:PQQ-binding-like beta-propeller repeat protein [Candidatus Bathyarchaeia archaeon]